MIQVTTRHGKNGSGHYHVVYIRPDGTALCGEAKGHVHAIQLVPPQMSMGPNGQPVPVGQPALMVLPAEDGHVHEMTGEEPERKERDNKEDDASKVAKARALYKSAKDTEDESRRRGQESEAFYDGSGQWKSEHKAQLEDDGRACLTINLVESAIDTISGYQRQNRTDIKMLPSEEGDARAADIFTALIRNVCDQNDFSSVETAVFMDQCIAGRGLFHSYADFDSSLEGDVVIETFRWDDAAFGPHVKIDASDAEYLAKWKWYTKDKIKQVWPEKEKDIQADYEMILTRGTTPETDDGTYEGSPSESGLSSTSPDLVNTKRKEYKVIEVEIREYTRVPVLVFADDQEVANADGWAAKDISALKALGFSEIKRRVAKMRTLTIAGSVLLDEQIADTEEFTLTPVYAKLRNGRFWGKIENAKDSQREVNKRHSQSVDIVNKMASYGWFTFPNSFPSEQEKRRWQKSVNKAGWNAEITDANNVPVKVEGTKIPSEVIELEQRATDQFERIINVNSELLGQGSGGQSGIAMLTRQKQGLLGNEFLFDNLSLSKMRLGRRLVGLIQEVYTPERILRVLAKRNSRPETPVEIAGKPLDQYPREELMDLLKNEDITKYDLVVGESQHSPSLMMSNYVLLLEAAQTGMAIPPEALLENSPLPQDTKAKALAALQNSQQAQGDADKQKYKTELLKTLGAKLPEHVAMGLVQQLMPELNQQTQQPGQQGMPPAGMPPRPGTMAGMPPR